MTRPDIAYYTSFLAQFMQKPTLNAWYTALSVAAYLNTTSNMGITFGAQRLDKPNPWVGPVTDQPNINTAAPIIWGDATFGNDSFPFIGGFVEWRDGPISWKCSKTKFVPVASTQVELAALVLMVKEGQFAYSIIEDMLPHRSVQGPMTVFTDNSACQLVVNNPGATKHTTHYERWLHYARDLRLKNKITVHHVKTECMMADIFTKPLGRTPFTRCRNYLMTAMNKFVEVNTP